LTPGAGNVQVLRNLVQGNSAGAGDGGGIRLAMVNGRDVAANPTNAPRPNGNAGANGPFPWYRVDLFSNMVVNNVAGLAGGGLSLQDAVNVRIVHDTFANNDSLAVAGAAFSPGNPSQSTPQPGAGIVSRAHSLELTGIPGATVGTFSNPTAFADNIVWQNRQFFFWVDAASGCAPGDPACTSTFGLCPDVTGALACPGGNTVVYNDLGVIGAAGALTCAPGGSCILTPTDPVFESWYANGARSAVLQSEITTAIQAPAAFDEGGNFIRPQFGPLSLYNDGTAGDVPGPGDGLPGTLFGNYHIQAGPAVNAGTNLNATYPSLATDFDGQPRPLVPATGVDIGADEAQ
jgi:hypothetical protein